MPSIHPQISWRSGSTRCLEILSGCSLGRVIDWCRHGNFKLWTQQYSPFLLGRASWCYAALPLAPKTHPIIGMTLCICWSLCRNPAMSSGQSPLFPILGNPNFPPGLKDGAIHRLSFAGRFQASHFLTFMPGLRSRP